VKILKYIIFLSILNSVFLVIYRQSDEKDFRRLWVSIQMSILIAATLAGLIPYNAEATYSTNATQPVIIERVVETPRGGFKTDPSQERVVLVSRIKEDSGLVRAAERACEDREVQDGINHLIDELAKGNPNPGIGNVPIGNGLTEYRHKKGGQVVARRRGNFIEILGKSGKDKTNQKFVINRVKRNLKQGLYD
jgi:hypothetical protein